MMLLFVAFLAGAHSMIDSIGELVELLSKDVSAAEITARVGPPIKNEPAPEALDLRPKLHGVKEASLTRYSKGEPFILQLVLTERPTLAELRDRFGAWKEQPVRFEQPRSVAFALPPGAHWKVTLIAKLEASVADIHDGDKPVALAFKREHVKP
jgi:hypothetical protein